MLWCIELCIKAALWCKCYLVNRNTPVPPSQKGTGNSTHDSKNLSRGIIRMPENAKCNPEQG